MQLAESGNYTGVAQVIRDYGIESGKIWVEIRADMPKDIVD